MFDIINNQIGGEEMKLAPILIHTQLTRFSEDRFNSVISEGNA